MSTVICWMHGADRPAPDRLCASLAQGWRLTARAFRGLWSLRRAGCCARRGAMLVQVRQAGGTRRFCLAVTGSPRGHGPHGDDHTGVIGIFVGRHGLAAAATNVASTSRWLNVV